MTARWFITSLLVRQGRQRSPLARMCRAPFSSNADDDPFASLYTPSIDPQTRITRQYPLSPELQRAVDEHVWAAANLEPASKRHMVRHHKLDDRKSLSKGEKRAKRVQWLVTPYLVIGAYQALVRRVQRIHQPNNSVQGDRILKADIPFAWFQTIADKIAQVDKESRLNFPKERADERMLILHETMAMLVRPIVAPYLPPHAWFLSVCHLGDVHSNDDPTTKLLKNPQLINNHIAQVEALARNVDYDTKHHTLLLWDLVLHQDKKDKDKNIGKAFAINAVQFKRIGNLVRPYIPQIWLDIMPGIFQKHNTGPTKKRRQWKMIGDDNDNDDQVSCLPALLVDLLFLHIDYSDRPHTNPNYNKLQQHKASDRKKQKIGIQNIGDLKPKRRVVQKANDLVGVHVDYFRFGTAIGMAVKGPEKLKEQVQKAMELELKSAMGFDRRMITDRSFSSKKILPPAGQHRRKGRITKEEKAELKEAKLAFDEEEKLVAIVTAGTKKTNNSARLRLQQEGREMIEALELAKSNRSSSRSK